MAEHTSASSPIEHMEALMEQLPSMTKKWHRYQMYMSAVRINQQFRAVNDLEQAIAQLERQSPREIAAYGGLHQKVIDEKRLHLNRERRRLDADLAHSPFEDVRQAHAALIPTRELNALVREVNRFREDYAYTLGQCQTAMQARLP